MFSPLFVPSTSPRAGLGPGTEDSEQTTEAPALRNPWCRVWSQVTLILECVAGDDCISIGDAFYGGEGCLACDLSRVNGSDFPTATFG